MLDMLLNKKVICGVLGGFVLGKAGDMIFGGDTAKKFYTRCATVGMIVKDNTMEKVEAIQAGASDIAADAREEADKYQAKKDAEFLASLRGVAESFGLSGEEEDADVTEDDDIETEEEAIETNAEA